MPNDPPLGLPPATARLGPHLDILGNADAWGALASVRALRSAPGLAGTAMTALIDTIEAAFVEERDATFSMRDGELGCERVVDAIERYVKCSDDRHGSLESVVASAYLDALRVWGRDWTRASGWVAERICARLTEWSTAAPARL